MVLCVSDELWVGPSPGLPPPSSYISLTLSLCTLGLRQHIWQSRFHTIKEHTHTNWCPPVASSSRRQGPATRLILPLSPSSPCSCFHQILFRLPLIVSHFLRVLQKSVCEGNRRETGRAGGVGGLNEWFPRQRSHTAAVDM